MFTLFECVYGSHLFGVSTPESDTDLKAVYCPNFEELVLGQTEAHSFNNGKEGPDKVEREAHSIQTFCRMVEQGQTLTYGMLFAPKDKWISWTPEWEELVDNRDRLVSKNLGPFVGYARSQAQKYSLKGNRLRTLKDFISTLDTLGDNENKYLDFEGRLLPETFEFLEDEYRGEQGIRLWTEHTANKTIRHIEVCGKSFGETTPLKLWVQPLQALLNRYGKRAMNAMESDGSDLKAMYHAVRLTDEMNELLTTGHITYPRPNAQKLMDIRNGKYTNEQVADMIDEAVMEGEALMQTSTLRDKPDSEWLRGWMFRTVRRYM